MNYTKYIMNNQEHYNLDLKLNGGKSAEAALFEAKYSIKESITDGEKLSSRDIDRKLEDKGFFNVGNGKFQYFEKPGIEPKFDSKELKSEVQSINLQRDLYEKIKISEIPKEPGFLTKLFDKEGAKATEKQIQSMKSQKEELPEIFIPDFSRFDRINNLEYPKRQDEKSDSLSVKPKEIETAFSKAVDKSLIENNFSIRQDARKDVLQHPIKIFNEFTVEKGISAPTIEDKRAVLEAINQNIKSAVIKDVEVEKQQNLGTGFQRGLER